ncbi:nucleoid-associated protein [Devosia naphthalenivorans]|uniref:nucleoid-associated protein n=1 Tax=Devosia naphthalenivorans TaxID=2082392 RepID=UPI0013B06A17|nr:nucleoid-associated protein [Devosia naphthalenivorans]
MILHIVGGEDDFLPQPEFEEIEHQDFFLARLLDVDVAPVHQFADASTTKAALERLARSEENFETAAQSLSRSFANHHRGNSRDGAFFVFEMRMGGDDVVYALAKYDYSQAIERYDREGRSGLRQIIQAFIADRKAIQKSCLVRVKDGVADSMVAARDRMKQAPDLTEYFERFLDVSRSRSDQELTQGLKDAVLAVLKSCQDLLPDRDLAAAHAVARDALRNRESVDNEAVQEAVFIAAGRPEDEATKERLDKATFRSLKAKRLDGIAFRPDPAAMGKASRKKIATAEGVRLEYPGGLENNGVARSAEPGGGTRITIITKKELVVDDVVPERAGR